MKNIDQATDLRKLFPRMPVPSSDDYSRAHEEIAPAPRTHLGGVTDGYSSTSECVAPPPRDTVSMMTVVLAAVCAFGVGVLVGHFCF